MDTKEVFDLDQVVLELGYETCLVFFASLNEISKLVGITNDVAVQLHVHTASAVLKARRQVIGRIHIECIQQFLLRNHQPELLGLLLPQQLVHHLIPNLLASGLIIKLSLRVLLLLLLKIFLHTSFVLGKVDLIAVDRTNYDRCGILGTLVH